MNYYGTEQHKRRMDELERQVFSKCDFSAPRLVTRLDEAYTVKHYYSADTEHQQPGYAPVDGEVCRLFQNGRMIFEWKHMGGYSRMSTIIRHRDGNSYLLYDEDLYGCSVLNLNTMESVHYIPAQSHADDESFEETFIWCRPVYDSDSQLLAVEGCLWACPYSVIAVDFSHPMEISEANHWLNVWEIVANQNKNLEIGSIDFAQWTADGLLLNITLWNKNGEEQVEAEIKKQSLLRFMHEMNADFVKES